MIVKTEIADLRNFEAWSGAKDTIQKALEKGLMDEINMAAEEIFCEGCTDTELNDWLWFDVPDMFNLYED